jgi:uncharacterized protein HemX
MEVLQTFASSWPLTVVVGLIIAGVSINQMQRRLFKHSEQLKEYALREDHMTIQKSQENTRARRAEFELQQERQALEDKSSSKTRT